MIESRADVGLASSDTGDLPLQYIRNFNPRQNLKRCIIHSDSQSDRDTTITCVPTLQSQDHTAAAIRKSRKHIRREDTCKRNSRKENLLCTGIYISVTGKTVPAKTMGPGCGYN